MNLFSVWLKKSCQRELYPSILYWLICHTPAGHAHLSSPVQAAASHHVQSGRRAFTRSSLALFARLVFSPAWSPVSERCCLWWSCWWSQLSGPDWADWFPFAREDPWPGCCPCPPRLVWSSVRVVVVLLATSNLPRPNNLPACLPAEGSISCWSICSLLCCHCHKIPIQ